MAGTTNFKQFNPAQNNQETDAAYAVDTTRVNGAGVDGLWPSSSANKTLYQVTTMVAALGQMLANKGFSVSDLNYTALVAQLANILTTADSHVGLQNLVWSPSVTLNAASFTGFAIPLQGATAISATGVVAGQVYVILYTQDSAGGHAVTFSSNIAGALQPDPTPNVLSTQVFIANTALILEPVGPLISNGAINATSVGVTVPATGAFTTLTANTPAATDNSTRVATTAWNLLGFAAVLGTNGYIKLPNWLGGFTFKWCQGSPLYNQVLQTTPFVPAFTSVCLFANVSSFGSGSIDTGEQVSFTTTGWTASDVTYFFERNADHGGMTVTPLIWAVGV